MSINIGTYLQINSFVNVTVGELTIIEPGDVHVANITSATSSGAAIIGISTAGMTGQLHGRWLFVLNLSGESVSVYGDTHANTSGVNPAWRIRGAAFAGSAPMQALTLFVYVTDRWRLVSQD